MRVSRLAPAVAAGALLVATVAPAQAQTDPVEEVPGVATSTGTLTVLGLDAGSLLSVDLLTDAALANTDAAAGAPMAAAQLSALAVDSPALGVSQEVPVVEVTSTGEPSDASQEITPIDNPVLSGSILPVSLRALYADGAAASELSAGLLDIDVLGGILSVAGTQVGLGSDATGNESAGLRGVDVDAISALDLEALLAGLGLPLADLPLDTLLGLIDSLGLLDDLGQALADAGVEGVDLDNLSAEGLSALAADLGSDVGELVQLQAELVDADPVCETTTVGVELLGELIGEEVTTICTDVTQAVEDAVAQVAGLTDQLGALLGLPLDLLSGQALISLEGLDVSIVTTATDSVDTSAASVSATLGGLTVGDLELGAIDLLGAAEQVTSVLDTAQSTLGGILGQIDPSLSDLITISTLQEETSVSENAAGGVTSTVDFVGLRIDVQPDLEALIGIIEGAIAATSVGDQLTELGLEVPGVPGAIGELNTLLAGTPTAGLLDDNAVFALSEGLTIEVASVSQSSSFAPGQAAVAAPELPALPTTGAESTIILLGSAAALAAAYGLRRRAQQVR